MKVVIESPFTVTDEKRNLIEEKINNLKKYNISFTQAYVFFKLDDGSKPNSVLAEIQLRVKGPEIFAKSDAEDFMDAFNKASSQVERQLRDKKDKRTDKHQNRLWKQI
jgi:ribosomal subunit interface protein